MINRELEKVTVISFESGVDEYGQTRTQISGTKEVDMYIKTYSNQLIDNPKYNEIEYLALTKDKTITSANQIEYNNIKYDIIYVMPSARYNQLFLRKFK